MAAQAGNIDAYWNQLLNRRAAWLHVFGRLKPGITLDAAKSRPRAVVPIDARRTSRSTAGFPNVTADQRREFLSIDLRSAAGADGLSAGRRAFQRPLWVIMAGSVILMLLASLNVAGLLLARGAARAREFTTRMAIGASRGRIAGQLLIESLLIALAGGVLGLLARPACRE